MNKRKIITLTLTQFCNLRCPYCFEANKSQSKMDINTIKKILDESLNDERFDEYEIDFFGGEPFLEFELMKETMKYVYDTYPNKLMLFTATTNGTLVHGEIQEWLKKHSDIFKCALSLDGNKLMHDINRCNSFDKIDIKFFAEVFPDQTMKMTISNNTLPYLSDGIIFMHNNNYKFTCNLAFDIDWSNESNSGVLERELMKLIEYYLSNPEIEPCELLDQPIYWVAMDKGESFRQCGAGNEMFSYDVNGKAYPCQFFMPLSIGEERAKESENIDFPDEITRENFVGECKECMALRLCHTCYGANYSATGNIFKKDMNWCKLQKIIFKANAYFRMKQIENNTFKCPDGEKYYWVKSIMMLLKEFK